ESLGKLKEVIEHARRLGLDFYYCLAPGLSMKYSDSEHLRLLKEKAKQIFDLGVRRFGLFFDDIPGKLQHADDRVRFSSLAEAHVHVCNAFCDALSGWDRDVRLAVCPTQYFGKGDESYIVELGRGLYPAIDLFWTGRQICSREITVDEAVRFQRFTGRPPLYWDNYPVNDARMTDEMPIGPYLGREAELYRFSRGLVSNGM